MRIVSKVLESPVAKKIPYVGPVVSSVGLAFDVKDIVESATPLGSAKIIGSRFVQQCTPPELYFAGKCVMFVGGVIASVSSGGNPIIVSGTLGAGRSIIRG